jgi:hypothetical protein
MADNDHRPLSEHSMPILVKVEILVEELLENKSVLPPGLFTELDTYHADLTAAIEGKQTGKTR